MMQEQLLLTVCMFGAVALVAYGAGRLLLGSTDQKLRHRLSEAARPLSQAPPKRTLKQIFQQIGQAAAEPFMPRTHRKQSALRRELSHAGIYTATAARVLIGSKVLLLAVGVAAGYLLGLLTGQMFLWLGFGGLLGYAMPILWLRLRIRRHQQALNDGLPDALDLMVVCVEAGLTLDASMQRVGHELSLAHPKLSRELDIVHMETRVGLPRAEALKNLVQRTGCEAIGSLAAMLIQADRFGTSIAGALRIHADGMRSQRQSKAEEQAARAAVKLTFPLVLFIFPATFIVLGGPTIMQLMNSPLFR